MSQPTDGLLSASGLVTHSPPVSRGPYTNRHNRSDLYQSRELLYGAAADIEQKAFFIINPKQQNFKNSKVRTTIPNNVLSKWMEDTPDSTSTLWVGLFLKQDFQG